MSSSTPAPATGPDRPEAAAAPPPLHAAGAWPPKVPLAPWRQTVRLFSRPVPFLHELYSDGGDVAELAFSASRRVVMTRDAADVKALFTARPDDVPSATARSPLTPLVGPHSVLITVGPEHLRQRRLLLPAFHGERLAAYRPVILQAAEAELATWRAGQRLAAQPRMQAITLEVILRAVFGVEDGARRDALRRAITDLLELTDSVPGAVMTIMAGRSGRIVGPAKRRVARMDGVIHDEISEHRRRGDLEQRDDILSLLMLARDEDGRAMGDDELRDELVTMLLAGHETTATSLAWALERLVRHPAAHERLAAEAREGDAIEFHDAVVHETLRDRPVIPFVARDLRVPMTIGGYALPAGTTAGADIWSTNHHAARYDDPLRFAPERFVGRKPDTYAWVPFGGGIRRCIGAAFAQLEMQIVLQAIMRRVDLRALDPASEPVRRRNITFVPRDKALVEVTGVREVG
jgi:cytochrome P450